MRLCVMRLLSVGMFYLLGNENIVVVSKTISWIYTIVKVLLMWSGGSWSEIILIIFYRTSRFRTV